MSSHHYSLISEEPSDVDEKEFSRPKAWRSSTPGWKCRSVVILLGTLLAASLSTNAILLYRQFHRPWELYNNLPTQLVGLRRDIPRDIVPAQEYASLNRTIQDAAWHDPKMVTWELFVALRDEYTVAQGLPHSQRWPWDSNKGVYIPVAAHELHCVHVLRSFANGKQDGLADADLEWSYEHAIHCLNILRESIMCNADEQLMYTGWLNANLDSDHVESGRGTVRMCRSWDKLLDWAHAHSACYLSINRKDKTFAELDRYKYCPDGSRPWETEELEA